MKAKSLLLGILLISGGGIAAMPFSSDTIIKPTSYLGISLGHMQMKVKDQLVMPVRYEGGNLNYGLSYLRKRSRSQQEIALLLSFGALRSQEGVVASLRQRFRAPTALLYWGTISYSYLHDFLKIAVAWNLQAGVSSYLMVNTRVSERWDNSAINYDMALTPLAIRGALQRDVEFAKRHFTLDFSLEVPILTFLARPEFAGVPDFLDHELGFLGQLTGTPASGWTGLGGFPRVTSQLGVVLHMRSSNRMRLSYTWDYYQIEAPMQVQNATHTYLFTLYTHL